jgi:hypothetical protein
MATGAAVVGVSGGGAIMTLAPKGIRTSRLGVAVRLLVEGSFWSAMGRHP